jgi:hypothetical protein
MSGSPEATRLVKQDLLLKADVLAHFLKGVKATDADLAAQLVDEIIERLREAVADPSSRVHAENAIPFERRAPTLVSLRSGASDDTDIEDFILDHLALSHAGLSIQEIVDRFEEASIDIKRQTLAVRLHRMVHAGKLASRARGHYILSEDMSRRYAAPK